MLITAGIERKHGKPLTDSQQKLVFENGFLWENAVAEYISTPEAQQIEMDNFISLFGLEEQRKYEIETDKSLCITRPGECCLDGIYMTPDGISMKLWYVHEWKSTAMRSKGFSIPARRIDWIWQVGAYCKVFGMTRAIIRVFHSGEFPQVVTQHVVDFTQEEVDTNWRQIREHYEFMKQRSVV